MSKDVHFDEHHFPFSSLASEGESLMLLPAADEWHVTKDVVLLEGEHTSIRMNVPASPSGSCPKSMNLRSCIINQSNSRPTPQISLGASNSEIQDDHGSSPDAEYQHPQSATKAFIDDFFIEISMQPDFSHHAKLSMHTNQRSKNAPNAPLTLDHTEISSFVSVPSSTRSSPTSMPSSRLVDFYMHLTEHAPQVSLSINIDVALLHPGWKSAMDDELASIFKNEI